MTYKIYKNLAEIDSLSKASAEELFFNFSGSKEFASRLAAARPFKMVENLYETAAQKWFTLSKSDWLEAFSSAHLGKEKETSGILGPATKNIAFEELVGPLGLYREKFGFIFILYASGKDPSEIIAVCQARFGNSVETELHIAAEEMFKSISEKLDSYLEK